MTRVKRVVRKPAKLWKDAWFTMELHEARYVEVRMGDREEYMYEGELKSLHRWLTRAVAYLEEKEGK